MTLLFAGSFAAFEVLDIDEVTPEEFSAEQPVAEGVRRTATSLLLLARRCTLTSADAALASLTQRIALNTARADCRLAAIVTLWHGDLLPRANLILRAAHTDSPTADPA